MSLINEALKRARQESRRREALAKGVPLAQPPRPMAHRSWMTAAVVALALALLLSLVTILRLARSEVESPPASTATVAGSEPIEDGEDTTSPLLAGVPTDSLVAADTGAETETPGSHSVEGGAVSSDSGEAERGAVPKPAPSPELVVRTPGPIESEAGPEAPSRAQLPLAEPPAAGVSLAPRGETSADDSATAVPSGQPEIFIGTATLAGGDTLELGGIAWSETGPYALLDNRVVGLGETIMGCMVTRIAPQEVELESPDGIILIRLK